MTEEKQMAKHEIMELLASESVNEARSRILKLLDATGTPTIVGHAAILSIADDINANENDTEIKNLRMIVDTYHEKVALAKSFVKMSRVEVN